MKYFSNTVIGLVGFAIVAGFYIAGSPQKARQQHFDEMRVNNLQIIQDSVLIFWQEKKRLPTTTDELIDSLRGWYVPVDPQTGQAFAYQVKEAEKFSLCADFSLASDPSRSANGESYPAGMRYYNGQNLAQGETWSHQAGRTCFDRTIDKEKYALPPTQPFPAPMLLK